MKNCLCVCALLGFALVNASPAAAQATTTSREPSDPPSLLAIFREEVKPGKAAAHSSNEQAWATAFTKGQAPIHWLGMTTLAGPNEAWFLSPYDSYAEFQKIQDSVESNTALTAEEEKFSALDGDLLSRTSTIIARYQPELSYQPKVAVPQMRFMQIDVVQVKPGHGNDFTESWRAIVTAHQKSKMNEHWAVYSVQGGLPTGTFLFMYPLKSLDHLDGVPAMHSGTEYRDAVGESGRTKLNEMMRDGVTMQQTLLFAFRPRMSLLPKDFIEQDSAFWAPKPPAVATTAKKAGAKPQ
jgi:hypothetical protein